MSRTTVPTLDLPDTSALDDLTVEDDALTEAWSRAAARVQARADREDRARVKARAATTAKRDAAADSHANDRWQGDVSEIHAFLTAHPAF